MVTVVTTVLGFLNSLSVGYVVFRITNDIERLPFPLASVQAGGATALAENSSGMETWRWRVFSIGSIIGMAWGLIYAGIPTLTSILLVTKIEFIPIPFADFTTQFEAILPATLRKTTRLIERPVEQKQGARMLFEAGRVRAADALSRRCSAKQFGAAGTIPETSLALRYPAPIPAPM